MSLDPQEKWRNASTQGGRHAVCQDGLLKEKLKDRANEKQEVMHIHDFCMMCEECGNIRHLGNNCLEIHEDMNFIKNNNYHPQQNQGWNQQQRPNY